MALLLIAELVLTACTGNGASRGGSRPLTVRDGFKPDTRITPAAYRLSEVECYSVQAPVQREDEIRTETSWRVRGRLENLLDSASPHYQLDILAELEDGRIVDFEGRVFFSIASGTSDEFVMLIDNETDLGSPVRSCEVVVKDSILNYVDR